MARRTDMWSDDPMPCDKCGEPHARCSAHTRAGKPCRQPAMDGQRVCRLHGGKSPRALAAAERRIGEAQARRALESFGAPAEGVGDPGAVLVGLIEVSVGLMGFYREQVRDLEPSALVWGVTKTKATAAGSMLLTFGHTGHEDDEDSEIGLTDFGSAPSSEVESKAAVSMWLQLFDAERDRLAALTVAALKAGVQERQIQLAEKQGQAVGAVIGQILDALLTVVMALVARLAPADGWQQTFTAEWGKAVGEVVPRHIRALGSAA